MIIVSDLFPLEQPECHFLITSSNKGRKKYHSSSSPGVTKMLLNVLHTHMCVYTTKYNPIERQTENVNTQHKLIKIRKKKSVGRLSST